MSLKFSPILALFFLLPVSSFEAVHSVSPSEGGKGIQSALDSLPAGGEVVLGAGTYVIHEPLRLRKDAQILRGAGPSTILYLADDANCPIVILGSLKAATNHPIQGVQLSDLFIDGNRTHQEKEVWRFLPDGGGVYNNGIVVWGTDGAEVDHVVCAHCRSGGLVSSAGTRRLTVQYFTAFDSQFDGLACYATEDSHFTHLNLHDNLAAGISLDLSFNHNIVRDAVLTNNDLGIFMRQSRDNIFDRVTIKQSHHHGIFMAEAGLSTATGWKLLPGSACTGNTFKKLVIAHCGGSGFRINDVGCTNNILIGGEFLENAQGGLSQVVSNLLTLHPGGADGALPSEVLPAIHQMSNNDAGLGDTKSL